MKVNNFWARTITGLSMVFLIIASLYFSRWGFAGIFGLVTVLGLWEFYSITTTEFSQPQKIAGTVLGTTWYIFTARIALQGNSGMFLYIWFFLLPFLFIPFVIEIFRNRAQPLYNIGITVMGITYIALPLSLLNFLNLPEYTSIFSHFSAVLLGYFLITWLYDTGAYLFGKSFGKHKFFERISPKKTWEGIFAGVVVALAAAAGLSYISKGMMLTDWLILAMIIIVFGTLGDLAESLLKRSLNLKDSGTILPGHGGILDRFDTIFLSAPFVFLFFVLRFIF